MTKKKQEAPFKSNLENIINEDASMRPEIKSLYIEMSKDFDTDFSVNLFLSSIELQEKYPFGLDMWQRFTTHPTISKYLGTYSQELMNKKVDSDIMSGSGVRDAVAVKKELSKNAKSHDNFAFVIMYIPEEDERSYESFDTFGEE